MRILSIILVLSLGSILNAQQKAEVKIKGIINLEKSFVFKFKDLKTKKINYFFSYKKDSCNTRIEIKKNRKYKISLFGIDIAHQNDGNKYSIGVDDFSVPKNRKLYYSDCVKGKYLCK